MTRAERMSSAPPQASPARADVYGDPRAASLEVTRSGGGAALRGTGVAIVGARSESLWTKLLFTNLKGWGYSGAIWPVTRSQSSVNGVKAFAGLMDLPDAPDAVVLATGAEATIELARSSVSMGVRDIAVVTDGFAERGTEEGRHLQRRLAEVVEVLRPASTARTAWASQISDRVLHLWLRQSHRSWPSGRLASYPKADPCCRR